MTCWYHIRCACHVGTTSGMHDMLVPHQVCLSCWYHMSCWYYIRCACHVGTTSGVHVMLVPHQVCMSCWYHIRCACHVGTTSGVCHVDTTSGVHVMLVLGTTSASNLLAHATEQMSWPDSLHRLHHLSHTAHIACTPIPRPHCLQLVSFQRSTLHHQPQLL